MHKFHLRTTKTVYVEYVTGKDIQGCRRQRFIRRTQAGRYCHTAVIFTRLAVFHFSEVTVLAEAANRNMAVVFRR